MYEPKRRSRLLPPKSQHLINKSYHALCIFSCTCHCHQSFLQNRLLAAATCQIPAVVAFAAATATTREARSTWTEQEQARPSYLSPQGMTSCATLYEILGISAVASNQEIKAAYGRLARVCHPDVAANDRKISSADEFMKIHAAYSTLSDPEKRASYDRSLFRRQRPLTTESRFPGYTSRNWETDQCW